MTYEWTPLAEKVAVFVDTFIDDHPEWYDHTLKVSAMAQNEDEFVVASLHDYIEDIPGADFAQLDELGLTPEHIAAVAILTRVPEQRKTKNNKLFSCHLIGRMPLFESENFRSSRNERTIDESSNGRTLPSEGMN